MKLIAAHIVDDAVRAFMHFAQARPAEFVNGMPTGRHRGSTFDAGDQPLDLQSRIVLRIAGNEVPDGLQIAPLLP
ncbi:MAG: hypothetical protein WEB53_14010 [Akkermansiaceae bacterium]